MKRRMIFAAVPFLLAGCGNEKPAVSSIEPFHIAKVEVVGPLAKDVAEWQMADLQQQTETFAHFAPETAAPRLLRLRIQRFHKKNPGMALLVGDSNNMTVDGEVFTMDGSVAIGRFSVTVTSDVYINGIIGAIAADIQKRDDVALDLNRKAGFDILEKIYGTKAWKIWTRGRTRVS